MVTVEEVERGIANFLDNEFMPQLPKGSLQRVAVGAAASIVIKKFGNIVGNLKNNSFVNMLGIFDENDKIDIDCVRDALYNNIDDMGVKVEVPLVGTFVFKKEDIDKLYRYIIG